MGIVAPAKSDMCHEKNNSGLQWLLNLDMIESNSGRLVEKILADKNDIGSSTVRFGPRNVLYSKLRPYLNKVYIPDDYGHATSELVPLLPDAEILEALFLTTLLRGDEFLTYISTQVSGTKMPRVQMNVFWDFDVIVPPIELQQQFAAFGRQSDKSKYNLQ